MSKSGKIRYGTRGTDTRKAYCDLALSAWTDITKPVGRGRLLQSAAVPAPRGPRIPVKFAGSSGTPLGNHRSMLLIAVAVLGGFAWYVMSPAERTKTVRTVVTIVRQLVDSARTHHGKVTPFDAALQERTPRVVVTPALLALNAITFLLMLVGSGSFSNPDTLMAWGGSFGPSTSNGQWWRLVTSMFVHAGFFSLLVNLIGLAQVASLLERMTGPLTLAAVYFGTGLIAGLVTLALNPVTVQVGATGAILGVYGLLIASLAWGLLNRSLTVPLAVLKPLAPAAGIFLLYVLAGGIEWTAAVTALATGLIGGLVLTRGITEHKPPAQRLAAAVAATMVIAAAGAVPLRGMAFIKPRPARGVDGG